VGVVTKARASRHRGSGPALFAPKAPRVEPSGLLPIQTTHGQWHEDTSSPRVRGFCRKEMLLCVLDEAYVDCARLDRPQTWLPMIEPDRMRLFQGAWIGRGAR